MGLLSLCGAAPCAAASQPIHERLEQVESEISRMSAEELAEFREWFSHFDADTWDRQMEADARAGRLDALAAEALRDHQNGHSTKL